MPSGRYNTDPPDVARLIADLVKRIENLESGNRIGNTSVDKGDLVVKSGASVRVLRDVDQKLVALIGNLQDLGLWGVSVFNPNPDFPVQNPLFEVGAGAPGEPFDSGLVNVIDRQGNFVFTLGSPFGLGSPYLAYNTLATSALGAPGLTTTSGTFASLWSAYGYTFHSKILVDYVIQNDVGTTSEVRLIDGVNGAAISEVDSWGSGAFAFGNVSYTHASSFTPGSPFSGMLFQADLQARRVSGAGNVKLQIVSAVGFG